MQVMYDGSPLVRAEAAVGIARLVASPSHSVLFQVHPHAQHVHFVKPTALNVLWSASTIRRILQGAAASTLMIAGELRS